MPETLVWSQFPWCAGCQESSNLRTPRFLNSQGRFPQGYSQSNTANGTKHPLWYPPQRQEMCLQESPFIWFLWSNWSPLDTWCRHLDEFRWYIVQQAMVQCFLLTKYNHFNYRDTSWNNFSVLQPILIQRTTFFSFFPLRLCRPWSDVFIYIYILPYWCHMCRLHAVVACNPLAIWSQWCNMKKSILTSLDSIRGATASQSGSPSVRLRKHCCTFLHADSVFPLTITSSKGSSAAIIWGNLPSNSCAC